MLTVLLEVSSLIVWTISDRLVDRCASPKRTNGNGERSASCRKVQQRTGLRPSTLRA